MTTPSQMTGTFAMTRNASVLSSDFSRSSSYLPINASLFYTLILLGHEAVVVYYALCSPAFIKFAQGVPSRAALSLYLGQSRAAISRAWHLLELTGLVETYELDDGGSLGVVHPDDVDTQKLFLCIKGMLASGALNLTPRKRESFEASMGSTSACRDAYDVRSNGLPFVMIDQVFRTFSTHKSCALLDLLMSASGHESYVPNFGTMGTRLRMSRFTISRMMSDFAACGLISITKRCDSRVIVGIKAFQLVTFAGASELTKADLERFSSLIFAYSGTELKSKRCAWLE